MRRAEQKITLYLTKGEHEESQQGKALQHVQRELRGAENFGGFNRNIL